MRKGVEPRLRLGNADLVQQLDARAGAARRGRRPSCTRSVSTIWKPTVKQGLRLVVGSWKTIAMSLPMMRRRSRGDRPSRSLAGEAHALGA